jgi:spermidine/putrescine transport system ATP-binding protein
MSDRIAVINLGRIEQLGEVSEIYHSPRTTFVANFIGQANILESTPVAVDANQARVRLNDAIELVLNTSSIPPASKNTLISIRPEKIHLQKTNPGGENIFEARVSEELFKGAVDQLVLTTDSGLELTAVVANESATQESFHLDDRVFCYIHPSDIVVVQGESAQADGVFGAIGS